MNLGTYNCKFRRESKPLYWILQPICTNGPVQFNSCLFAFIVVCLPSSMFHNFYISCTISPEFLYLNLHILISLLMLPHSSLPSFMYFIFPLFISSHLLIPWPPRQNGNCSTRPIWLITVILFKTLFIVQTNYWKHKKCVISVRKFWPEANYEITRTHTGFN